jgi:FkbM family methyltransferase
MITLLLAAAVALSSGAHVPNITRDLKVVFYVNLDRQPSRREHMESELREAGLSARRWSAISRERVEAGEFDEDFVKRQGVDPVLYDRRRHTEEEANGTIGCFLSHTLALLEASKELAPDDLLLMLEDDLRIPVDWRMRMQAALDQAPKDWQLLKVAGWGNSRRADLASKPRSGFEEFARFFRSALQPWTQQAPQMDFYRLRGPFREESTWTWLTGAHNFYYAGTGGYLVRGSAIETVLRHLRSQPIDDLDAMYLSKDLPFYEAWPHVFDLNLDAFNGVGLHGSKAMDEGAGISAERTPSVARISREAHRAKDEDGLSTSVAVSPASMEILSSGTSVDLNSVARRAPIRMHNHSSMSARKDAAAPVSMAQDPTQAKFGHPLWLKSCASIYLDVGTNIGVQVRKLFEPERYPDAPMLQLFNERFGAAEDRTLSAEQSGLCALGLEPNPQHKAHLRRLEEKYSARGWRAHFYPFAAWKEEGFMLFNEAVNSSSGDQGAMLAPSARNANATVVQVRTVNLAEFIKSLPPHSVKFLKVDIEGAEYQTVMRMVQEGVLCEGTVDAAFIEVHRSGDITNWKDERSCEALARQINKTRCGLGGAVTTLVDVSDDMYFTDEPEKDLAEKKAEEAREDHERFVKRCYMAVMLALMLLIGGAGFHYRGKSERSKADQLRDHRLARYSFASAQTTMSAGC